MPKEVYGRDFAFLPRDQVLTFEEIFRLAGLFALEGVEKLRITGGEPLARHGVPDLIAMLAELRTPGGRPLELTLTTNGSALRALAPALRAAGLDRVTVSLDSLDEATFRAMNGVDFPVAKVLDGIDAAREAGFGPIKVNMVVRRGVNETSVVEMARWARAEGHILRFIEYMDVGHSNGWRLDEVVPAEDVVAAISAEMPLVSIPPNYPGEVADRWRYADGGGEVGVIASVTSAVLRRLHAGPDLGRRPALHLPVRGEGDRPPRSAPSRDIGCRRRAASSGPSGRPAPIATPSCDPRRPPTCRGSRCSRWAASRVVRAAPRACLSTVRPQGVESRGHAPDARPRSWWTSALTLSRSGS